MPRIVAATVEQFVPQMVNLELVGGVNFQKGCYPGQESRGAQPVPRHAEAARLPVRHAMRAASAGQELFAAADPDQPAGMVAASAPAPDGSGRHAVLAETKIAALDAALHLGSVSGPLLRPLALPYALPTEA